MSDLTRSQVDRAGRRIRAAIAQNAEPDEADLTVVERFREAHLELARALQQALSEAHAHLVALSAEIGQPGDYAYAARPKTTEAIVAKLGRSTTSLSQMQDIVGGRLVVPTPHLAAEIARVLSALFEPRGVLVRTKDTTSISDPLGYRAIHLVLRLGGRLAEVQIRTTMQQRWAQIVERLDQAFGTDLKHGLGPQEWLEWLLEYSEETAKAERGEAFSLPDPPIFR